MAQRHVLETVLETEVLDSPHSPGSATPTVDEWDFWNTPQGSTNIAGEGNAALLDQLFHYKEKLADAENKVQQLEARRDKEMKYIVSRLLMLEGRLIKDKKIVENIIDKKDKTIRRLQSLLAKRNAANMEDCTDAVNVIHRNSSHYEAMDEVSSNDQSYSTSIPRRSTHPNKRLIRDIKSYSSPVFCDVECQTESLTSSNETNKYDSTESLGLLPRELRSYSNPDDLDQVYEKTSEAKVKDKDMVIVSTEPGHDSQGSRRESTSRLHQPVTRKKSLSSPDLQQLLLDSLNDVPALDASKEPNNNKVEMIDIPVPSRKASGNLNSANYLDEVDYYIAARLASPRPSLPNITICSNALNSLSTIDGEHWTTKYPSNSSSERSSATISPSTPQAPSNGSGYNFRFPDSSNDQSCNDGNHEHLNAGKEHRVRKQSALLKRSKVYLRSYSTPNASCSEEDFAKQFSDIPMLVEKAANPSLYAANTNKKLVPPQVIIEDDESAQPTTNSVSTIAAPSTTEELLNDVANQLNKASDKSPGSSVYL